VSLKGCRDVLVASHSDAVAATSNRSLDEPKLRFAPLAIAFRGKENRGPASCVHVGTRDGVALRSEPVVNFFIFGTEARDH
jgi:hypothetical protein